MIEGWISEERNGNAVAADALESATEFLEQVPEVIVLPEIKIPGRLGPAANRFAVEAIWRWRDAARSRGDDEGQWIIGVELVDRLLRTQRLREAALLMNELLDEIPAYPEGFEVSISRVSLDHVLSKKILGSSSNLPALLEDGAEIRPRTSGD